VKTLVVIMGLVLLGTLARADVLNCTMKTATAGGVTVQLRGTIDTRSYYVDLKSKHPSKIFSDTAYCGATKLGSSNVVVELCEQQEGSYLLSTQIGKVSRLERFPITLINGAIQVTYKNAEIVTCRLAK
jgi:hypothetical protein